MKNYLSDGTALRIKVKELILDFMRNNEDCLPNAEGLTTADIFRACGLDWGTQDKATSSNQQYWTVALLQVLKREGVIQRDIMTKKWRIK